MGQLWLLLESHQMVFLWRNVLMLPKQRRVNINRACRPGGPCWSCYPAIPIFESSYCHSFTDRTPVDILIFRLRLTNRAPTCQLPWASPFRQFDWFPCSSYFYLFLFSLSYRIGECAANPPPPFVPSHFSDCTPKLPTLTHTHTTTTTTTTTTTII